VTKPLKIAVAGLGTVGAGTIKLLFDHADMISARCGRNIVCTAVAARNRAKDRGVSMTEQQWFDDPVTMAAQADADVIVELIGGSSGAAKAVCETAIAHGRHVVTANKALLAVHGNDLARLAEDAGVTLAYEASVAGGIPIIKALREGLVGNKISALSGILNGTCNYILTTMRETGRDFSDVLAEAQQLGYAEADPSFDIDGVDAAHKLTILSSLAFGHKLDFAAVKSEGIRHISAEDIRLAGELGYRIKLLGIARSTEHGIEQRVYPCMVPLASPIAQVEGVFNAVEVVGDYVGRSVYEGRGAGAGPTASAVVADLVDIALGRSSPTFGIPATKMKPAVFADPGKHLGAYYVRLMVRDKPGVLADVTAALRDENVSIESVIQRSRAPDGVVPLVMTLHETEEANVTRALARIEELETVTEPPRLIRIEGV